MKLTTLRDDAFSAAQPYHEQICREINIYNNEQYGNDERLGRFRPLASKSIDPKIGTGINRMRPAMLEQAARIQVEAKRSAHKEQQEYDIILAEDLQNWLEMMEDVDGEQQHVEELVTWNLVCGNAISKVMYDPYLKTVTAPAVNPLNFAPDPASKRADLMDAQYVVQTNWHSAMHLLSKYGKDRLPDTMNFSDDNYLDGNRVDELWMTTDVADACGYDVSDVKTPLVVSTLINDEPIRSIPNPYNYPHYPHQLWRNFTRLMANNKGKSWWGFGYGTLMWPQQKLYDELLCTLIMIGRNISFGKYIARHGVLDIEKILSDLGTVIELNPDVEGPIGDNFQNIPADQVPPLLTELVLYTAGILEGMMPTLNPVTTGESPSNNASGKAINSLQYAAFNQLAANVSNFNEFRMKRAIRKCVLIQQFARNPMSPYLWRGGLSLPDRLPEDARNLEYFLTMPSHSGIPNTPQGKIELTTILAQFGAIMTTEKLIEFLGLDRGFGLKESDFINAAAMGADGNPIMNANQQINTTALAGGEV